MMIGFNITQLQSSLREQLIYYQLSNMSSPAKDEMESSHWSGDLIEVKTKSYSISRIPRPNKVDFQTQQAAFPCSRVPPSAAHAPLCPQGPFHTCGLICGWISVFRVGVGAPCLGGGFPSLPVLRFRFGPLFDGQAGQGLRIGFRVLAFSHCTNRGSFSSIRMDFCVEKLW